MEASNLGFQIWAIAVYLMSTSLKGVSSMKLHRDLGITQKSAWHLAMRLRKALEDDGVKFPFAGPVEADETYIGGKEGNKHVKKKLKAGRGAVGKTAVVGVRDRATGHVVAQVVEKTDARTLQGFVATHTAEGAQRSTQTTPKRTRVSPGLMRRSGTQWANMCANRPTRTGWKAFGHR